MKKSLSQFSIGALVVAVVLAGAGGGAYFWASSQFEDAKTQVDASRQKLSQLQGRRYLPSRANVKTLQENNEASRILVSTVTGKLKSDAGALSQVQEMNPVEFKNKLDVSIKKLRGSADLKKIELPANFHFSFGRYVQSNPSQTATLILGKQLLGIEQAAALLFDSGITKLNAVRRSFDEDGSSSTPLQPSSEAEALKIKGGKSADGLYRIYPLEMDFEGSPRALREFVIKLTQGPSLFVTRSIQVSNLDPLPKRREDLKKNDGNPADATASAPVSAQPPRTVLGLESIRAKVRFDLVEWIGTPLASDKVK